MGNPLLPKEKVCSALLNLRQENKLYKIDPSFFNTLRTLIDCTQNPPSEIQYHQLFQDLVIFAKNLAFNRQIKGYAKNILLYLLRHIQHKEIKNLLQDKIAEVEFTQIPIDSTTLKELYNINKSCRGIILENEDCNHMSLERIDLRRAILKNVDFRGANLKDSQLNSTTLYVRVDETTNLEDAVLGRAQIKQLCESNPDSKITYLRNIILMEENGRAVDLRGLDLSNVYFGENPTFGDHNQKAKLSRENIRQLTEAFRKIPKQKGRKIKLNLHNANLKNIDVGYGFFRSGLDLRNLGLGNSNIKGTRFDGVNLKNVGFNGVISDEKTSFRYTTLTATQVMQLTCNLKREEENRAIIEAPNGNQIPLPKGTASQKNFRAVTFALGEGENEIDFSHIDLRDFNFEGAIFPEGGKVNLTHSIINRENFIQLYNAGVRSFSEVCLTGNFDNLPFSLDDNIDLTDVFLPYHRLLEQNDIVTFKGTKIGGKAFFHLQKALHINLNQNNPFNSTVANCRNNFEGTNLSGIDFTKIFPDRKPLPTGVENKETIIYNSTFSPQQIEELYNKSRRDFRGIRVNGSLKGLCLQGADFSYVDIDQQGFGENIPTWYLHYTPGLQSDSKREKQILLFITLLKVTYHGEDCRFYYKIYLFIWSIFNPTLYTAVDNVIKQHENSQQTNDGTSSSDSLEPPPKRLEDFYPLEMREDSTLKQIFNFTKNYYTPPIETIEKQGKKHAKRIDALNLEHPSLQIKTLGFFGSKPHKFPSTTEDIQSPIPGRRISIA